MSHESKKNLSCQIAEDIYNMIIVEEIYSLGEKLSNEIVLAKELGVSRATLREAIQILVAQGILEVKRGRGTYVTADDKKSLNIQLNVRELLNQKVAMKDLYETRLLFEPEVAALVCKRATDKELKKIIHLGEACEKILLKNKDYQAQVDAENAFHGAIVKACHNDFFIRFMPMIDKVLRNAFTMSDSEKKDMMINDAINDHRLIMNFLEKRDANAVRGSVIIHIHHAIWTQELPWNSDYDI